VGHSSLLALKEAIRPQVVQTPGRLDIAHFVFVGFSEFRFSAPFGAAIAGHYPGALEFSRGRA